MFDALMQLALFTAKATIIVVLILILLTGILALLARGKEKISGKIKIDNLNKKYKETTENLLAEILPKEDFKKWTKAQKQFEKDKSNKLVKNIFVIDFHGDIKASAVTCLSEEVTAVLGIAKPEDEVVVRVESGGGMVHAYGLAAAQLARIRQKAIPLTVTVDKIAASGGYMMATIANKILAAPFAIIGSIGVVIQLPNFHRLLKEKHVDFEQLTAGNFKRTLTVFGQNTDEGRDKMQEEIEDIHILFKNLIKEHRQQIDIDKVATGEHWLGSQALELQLIDHVQISDDYLLEKSREANLYKICFHAKKSMSDRLFSTARALKVGLSELLQL